MAPASPLIRSACLQGLAVLILIGFKSLKSVIDFTQTPRKTITSAGTNSWKESGGDHVICDYRLPLDYDSLMVASNQWPLKTYLSSCVFSQPKSAAHNMNDTLIMSTGAPTPTKRWVP